MAAPIPAPRSAPAIASPTCVVVVFPAEIDLLNATEVEHTLKQLADNGAWLLLDLSATTFCDTSGVRAISRAQERVQQLGGWIGLVSAHPMIHQLLELTDMDRELHCYPSRDAALAELPATSPPSLPVITLDQHPLSG